MPKVIQSKVMTDELFASCENFAHQVHNNDWFCEMTLKRDANIIRVYNYEAGSSCTKGYLGDIEWNDSAHRWQFTFGIGNGSFAGSQLFYLSEMLNLLNGVSYS